jgi:hypothetical protein
MHFRGNLFIISRPFSVRSVFKPPLEGVQLARKTVLVCDQCGREVDEGKGATMRLSFSDARRGAKEADLCDSCATGMPGRATARRGRKPKSSVA